MNEKNNLKNMRRAYNSIITFQHLRYAIAAADQGSFRRAAESLLVRQSTLSRRCIRQLEYSIGLTIFERSSGGVRATKSGFNFLRISRSILEQVASLVESTRRAGENKARQLAVGFGSSLSTGNLRETIIDHTRRFSQIETVLMESSRIRVGAALLNGTIDIAILTGQQSLPDCAYMPLWSEKMLVVLPEGHSLTSQEAIYLTDLENDTILLSQYDSRFGLEGLAVPKPSPPDDRLKIKSHNVSLGTIQNLVSMGLGVSLVNESDVATSISGLVYRQIREGAGSRQVDYSAYWRGDNENPALAGFLKLLATRYPNAIPDLKE